jgi:hypothetical protein
MHTPTHVLIGLAALGHPGQRRRNLAVMVGAFLPDLPAILMVLWARYLEGRSPGEIFRLLYFSDVWQTLMAPWHAFPVWGAVAAAGLALRQPLLIAFAVSGLLHLACDFPVHVDDAHRQFWPLTDWRFHSPVSYWDPAHYGNIVAPLEGMLAVSLTVFLIIRFKSPPARSVLAVVLIAYIGTLAYFARVF